MLFVEVRALPKGDEKLRIVRVFSAVGHRHHSPSSELQSLVKLVFEGSPVDGLSPRACASGVSCLDHEPWDDPVKDCVIVVALETELDEVAASKRHFPRP